MADELKTDAEKQPEAGSSGETKQPETAGANAETKQVEAPAPVTDIKRDQPIEQVTSQAKQGDGQPKVSVKPLRSYHDSETGKFVTPNDDAYPVSRRRALELRANGLVEFESEADEEATVRAHVASTMAKSAARAKRGDALPPNSKSTPLKNPKPLKAQ